MTSLPSLMAVLIRPIPPNSPTMKTPGTLVSKFSLTFGTLTVWRASPKVRTIACVGQTSTHLAWPVHLSGSLRMALPLTIASVPVSGQTSTQLWQPTQRVALMTGLGLPFSPVLAPSFCTAATWMFQMDRAAPHSGQKVELLGMDLLHRGHGRRLIGAPTATAPPAFATGCWAAANCLT